MEVLRNINYREAKKTQGKLKQGKHVYKCVDQTLKKCKHCNL